MNVEEFAEISRRLQIGDTPGTEFGNDIELVYMNTDLTKEDMAVLYLMATGYFERLVDMIKVLMKSAANYRDYPSKRFKFCSWRPPRCRAEGETIP